MLLTTLFAAMLSPTEGKTMARDDWQAATIVAVGSPVAGDPATYLTVQAGDLDGDGRADDAYLKLMCDGASLSQAFYQVKGPREAASGQASGKRQHKPVTFVKEWGAATPMLAAFKPTYDVKKAEGSRRVAAGDWAPISLSHTDGLCAAAGEAVKKATKTRSNIQNN